PPPTDLPPFPTRRSSDLATLTRLAAATTPNRRGPVSESRLSGPTRKVVDRSATLPAASMARSRTEWDPSGRSTVRDVVPNDANGPLSTLTSNRATPEPPSVALQEIVTL